MEKQLIIPAGVDASKVFMAPGVIADNLIFPSGSAGLKDGKVAGPDIESQARQAFENIGAVLKAAGSGWEKVVKVTCYLTNPKRDIGGWNKVFGEYFPKNPPSRTTIGCSLLNDEWLIEIELVALK
jgi:2-iminobutanoate/2-iminopropanoate deaminase